MEDILDKMDPEKRIALINSALKEFGNNTYEKASTNVIVKDAGISKGLLYHYFSNKESLYEYLYHFLFKKTAAEIMDSIGYEETDIMDRIVSSLQYKINLLQKYPNILDFTKRLYREKSLDDLKAMIAETAPTFYQDFYTKNIDYSKFREGVDIQKALEIVQWTVEKFSEDYAMRELYKDDFTMEKLMNDFKPYMDMLKATFYK